jgi:diguanylate cyclase (GGDEF)-like protein/PAS domain S-box-containing protein
MDQPLPPTDRDVLSSVREGARATLHLRHMETDRVGLLRVDRAGRILEANDLALFLAGGPLLGREIAKVFESAPQDGGINRFLPHLRETSRCRLRRLALPEGTFVWTLVPFEAGSAPVRVRLRMEADALAGLRAEDGEDLLPLLAADEDRRLAHLARRAGDAPFEAVLRHADGERALHLRFDVSRDGMRAGVLRLAPYDGLGDRLAMVSEIWRHVRDVVIVTDVGPSFGRDFRILFASPAVEAATGWSPAELMGRSPKIFQGPRTCPEAVARIREAIRTWSAIEIELLNYRKDGTPFRVELSIAPVADRTGWFTHWIALQRDVTRRHERLERAEAAARRDALTGLGNRRHADVEIPRMIARSRDAGERLGIVRLDLDRFKAINDAHGHAAGDLTLAEAGRRLAQAVRRGDLAVRLGGDEFLAVCGGLSSREDLDALARRIQEAVDGPVPGTAVMLRTSVGAALFPDDGRDMEALLGAADEALYLAKETGRGRVAVFSPAQAEVLAARRALLAELPQAIGGGEIEAFLQPQICAGSGAVIGAEALARWRHPSRGLLAPGAFLDAAVRGGLAADLDEAVARSAFRAVAAWKAAGAWSGRISINLSDASFARPGIARRILALAADVGLEGTDVAVEVLEEACIGRGGARVVDVLAELRAAGLRIDLDDFGTGHASLTHLTVLPIDRVKLHRSFVVGADRDPRSAALLEGLVGMLRRMDIGVTAEGIETEAQAERLRALGCQTFQGFLYAPPMDAAAFAAWRAVRGVPSR